MKIPYPFQVIGRDFLANRTEALLADDMGLGKTLQAIEAIKARGLTKGIIVCPHAVRRQWVKNIREQYPTAFVKELTKKESVVEPNAINVINYDIVWRPPIKTNLKNIQWEFIICDEAHFLKAWDSNRTIACLGKQGLYRSCTRRWMLTGTPVLNRPVELYPMLRALAPYLLGEYTDYYKFAKRFCGAFMDHRNNLDVSGATNLAELAVLVRPFFLRRLKTDVLSELPPIIYEKIYTDRTDKIIQAYKHLEQEIGDVASLRRAVGIIKTKQTIEHITDVLTTKEKVLVFAYHKDVVDAIVAAFPGSVQYTGGENAKQKEEAIRRFISDNSCRVFVGNIKAAGFGIDGLQEVCDHCIFAEISYVPGELNQAVDRIYRIGQTKPVTVQFIVAEDSMEEDIINSVTSKSKNIKTILQEGGEIRFVGVECAYCQERVELKDATRVAQITVCKKCKREMECLL